nr:hypothetical protein [Mycoplasmopsis bovis]
MAHLNLIIQRRTFLNDQEKARLKVAKILPYFTLGLIYQRANLSQTNQGNSWRLFWGLLENVPALGNISCDKGFRTKAITELLEQKKS